MKQFTEDYVSYEVAVLLKEKGFDEECHAYWHEIENRLIESWSPIYGRNISNPYFFGPCAPTLQMAMKWLREVCNIHIQVLRYPAKIKKDSESNKYSKPWYYQYSNLTEIDGIDMEFIGMDEYDTYEEAVEAAILYVLKNLI